MSIVDAVDVMRTGRPYQPARSYDWILDELRRESGGQFDPELVAALMAVMPTDGTIIKVPPLVQPERRAVVGRRQDDAAIGTWLRGDTAMVRTGTLRI